MQKVKDWRMWVLVIGVLGGVLGLLATGYFLGQWSDHESVLQASREKDEANAERKALMARIPVIRKEEYAAGVASSAAEIASLKKQVSDFGDMKSMVADSHEIVAYTLRFLGKRAEITDARTAALLKQSKMAAAAAVEAKQSLDSTGKELAKQAAKVDAAASAVQSAEKKLSPPQPPPQPSKGWFGFGGH